jgi:hypothetical protein
MTTCNTCNHTIPDPAEAWPSGSGGTICQECWEAESAGAWWDMVRALGQADVLEASGAAAWEAQS